MWLIMLEAKGRVLVLVLLLLVSWLVSIPGVAASESVRLQVVSSSGITLVDIPLQPGERWCLVWNHSVTGIRVEDCYRYHQGKMVLERSHQPDFAAGLGHIPGRGVQTSDGKGGYWIEHIDEPVSGNRYLLRVGSMAVDHRLSHDGKLISLSALAAGERVIIRLQPDNTTS
nr:DUF1850 domain-containing protein [uncultured Halomonas sp.]